ncbi:MAG: glycosyltransferase family 2 protein [Betaproteobacteria bacterium]|nr:MAG: glycosyltransferase family 2 protein [Betaproteobacteria bacterium]
MAIRNPVVSVCVPTYNGSAFLAQTLQSIAAQTFEDYEVVIVDDNSTDDSVAVARRYAGSDPRVMLFEPSQRAGSSARNANRCLAHARGEWIKFIFQDDVMAPHCLSSLLDATRDGHRFALSWHDYHFEAGVDDEARAFYERLATLRTTLPGTYAAPEAFCEAVLANWCKNFLGPTSSSFIHRECFARYGAFSSEIVTFPDLEYWIRVGNNEGLAIAPEYLVTFRVHAKSISAGLRNSRASIYRNALERVLLCLNLAFAPEYAPMRAYVRARTPALEVNEMLTKQAKGTRWLAIDAKYRNDDLSLLEQWGDFVRVHPQVVAVLRDADRNQQSLMERMKSFLSFGFKH